MDGLLIEDAWRWPALFVACLGVGAALGSAPAAARTFHTNYSFPPTFSGPLPANPGGKLVADAQGRLYGTTIGGGTFTAGTVYRLTPGAMKSAPWTIEILHSFTPAEGDYPFGGVVLGASGEIYGTTQYDGTSGNGAVFRLDNTPGWPITVLHYFGKRPDGYYPESTLVLAKNGLLYGTTYGGGEHDVGIAFEVSPQGDQVAYNVIHSFGAPGDGIQPDGDIVMSGDGAIHGITDYNRAYNPPHTFFYNGPGTVFELAKHDGEWKEKLIYATAQDYPSSVTSGPDGALFACSIRNNTGLAIQLSPAPGSLSPQWAETDLFTFGGDLGGCSSLTVNPKGGFVGTGTYEGGVHSSGALFSLNPLPGQSGYTSTLLHRFSPAYEFTVGSLIRQGGLYYGATGYDSSVNGGTVFDMRP